MKKYFLLFILGAMAFNSYGALRECSFYEIMNDADGDGLVQKNGVSVCYYLNKTSNPGQNSGPSSTPIEKVSEKQAAKNSSNAPQNRTNSAEPEANKQKRSEKKG